MQQEPQRRGVVVPAHLHERCPNECVLPFPRSEYKRRLKAKEKEAKDAAKAAEKVSCEPAILVSRSGEAVLTLSSVGQAAQAPKEKAKTAEEEEELDPTVRLAGRRTAASRIDAIFIPRASDI